MEKQLNAQDILSQVSEQNPVKTLVLHTNAKGGCGITSNMTPSEMMLMERMLRCHVDNLLGIRAEAPKSAITRI